MAGGIGVWRYGGTVKITSFPKGLPSSSVDSESTDESLDESESSLYEQLSEFLQISSEVSIEESKVANVLSFLFDSFVLRLIQAYLLERNGIQDLPLNSMVGKIRSISWLTYLFSSFIFSLNFLHLKYVHALIEWYHDGETTSKKRPKEKQDKKKFITFFTNIIKFIPTQLDIWFDGIWHKLFENVCR